MFQSRVWLFFFIALTLALAFTTETSGFEHSFIDFSVYFEAAKNIRRGVNPYATPYIPFRDTGPMMSLYYLYPPFIAIILSFLESLGAELLKKIWILLSFCSLSGGVYLLWRAFTDGKVFSHWQIVTLLALVVFPPTMDGIGLGQVDAFVFFFLALTAWAISKEQQVVAGISIALAASIKFSPLLLALLLYRFRYQKGKTAFYGTLFIIAFLPLLTQRGFALNYDYVDTLANLTQGQAAWTTTNNYSIAHFLIGVFPELSLSKAAAIGEILALFLLGYLFLFRTSFRVQNRLILYSGVICVMILFSPYISFHHLLWAVIPAGAVIYVEPRSPLTAKLSWTFLVLMGLSLLIDRYLDQNGVRQETLDLIRPGLVVLPLLGLYSMLSAKLKTLN